LASLSLVNLSKAFDQEHVVSDVNLEVEDGEFVVLVGPSGCGKSTTLRMIAGLEQMTGGTIRIGDKVVNGVHPADRNVAMVFQSYALYPHMSVYDNLAYGLKRRRMAAAEIAKSVAAVAQMLKIEGLLKRRPAQLSGGQRQRVALGRAIVRQPAVFLMDEPLSNLDAKLRVDMRAELARLHTELKVTTVYVTHDQVEAMTMGDRIVVMNGGHIEQAGRPLDLYRQPASLFVARFIGLPEINIFEGAIRRDDWRTVFVSPDFPAPLPLPAAYREGPAALGLRPQALTGVASGMAGGTAIGHGDVVAIEHHGPESFAFCRLPSTSATVEVAPASGIAIGDRIAIFADLGEVHLFDPASGRRLEPVSASGGPST